MKFCQISIAVAMALSIGTTGWLGAQVTNAPAKVDPNLIASPAELKARIPSQLCITRPDYVVFVPEVTDAGVNDTGNEHFLVFDGPDGSLMAIWTQSSAESQPDQHIAFSRSTDEGATWTKPRIIAGPKVPGEDPIASWAFPLVSKRGRIYVLYSQHVGKFDTFPHTTGRMDGIYSDDNGQTWSKPQTIPMPRTCRDNPDTTFPGNWICWQKPLRLTKDGRYYAGITRWTSKAVKKNPTKSWISHDSVVEFMRFDNIDDNPGVASIEISWFASDKDAITVPFPGHPEVSACQEPLIVKLPDGRLFCVMRTSAGSPYWTVSADDGQTWAPARRLLRKDGGEPLLHPLSPCPIYDVGGNEAGSGRYALFIHNHDGHYRGYKPTDTSFHRRPVYIVPGRFQPGADQPVWFDEPRFFMDHDGVSLGKPGTRGRTDLALYSSFTFRGGKPVLWYPERKFFLLGKHLPAELFGDLAVASAPPDPQSDDLQIIRANGARMAAPRAAPERIAWWRDARFGMFIHWGLFSIPAGVWEGRPSRRKYAEHIMLSEKIPMAEYAKLAGRFNPQKFSANEWVGLAKRAGMRYLVFVTKHQDGFAMFDSKTSDFDIVDATPFGRDPAKELAAAAKAQGLKMGFYYSHARDHHHPLANWNKHGNTWDFPQGTREDFIRYLNEKARPQIRELLTQYGDVGVMWFDVPYDIPPEESRAIVDLVHGLQPGCLVNSRVGGAVWDYQSLGDNQIADAALDEPWETCMTLNDSWGFHSLDHNWKTSAQVTRHLADIVSKGGNLLLNIGPKADGTIPEESVRCLDEVGRWMAKNGESIHGASASPIGQPAWGRCTSKGNRLYLHVFDWPADGKLIVGGLDSSVSRAAALADGTALEFSGKDKGVTIALPPKPADPAHAVILLETGGRPALPTAPATKPQPDPATDWKRSKPDVAVYVPKGEEHHDTDNEHFLVFPTPGGKELLALWTQSSVEGRGDNRAMLARSADGVTWSEPKRIAGTAPGGNEPQASWAFPVVAKTGRIYLFFTKQAELNDGNPQGCGTMGCRFSDDEGHTWKDGADIPMPRNRFDNPDPRVPKNWIVWQRPIRDSRGRWLAGYTQCTSKSLLPPEIAKRWYQTESRCQFMRFENLDEGPAPEDLKITWLPNDDAGLEVTHPTTGRSAASEPSVALLPDGRLFSTMRTWTGEIWYSVSDDDGHAWRRPEILRYRDGGDPVLHPLAPCPIYALQDGRYLLLFHNNNGHVGIRNQREANWKSNHLNYIRRPAFIAVGEFRPRARQPIWFSGPKQILDTQGVIMGPKKTAEIATYTSLTEWNGRRVLWYPDRKYYLLGKYLPDGLLSNMSAPKANEDN